ncbi:hypothetical protein HMPREF9413_3284 [Paenibacillus sp. HGF7]|nr:hypothetical protein HMPREF9413_3284 [Paenibacillus sp. HGF7]
MLGSGHRITSFLKRRRNGCYPLVYHSRIDEGRKSGRTLKFHHFRQFIGNRDESFYKSLKEKPCFF